MLATKIAVLVVLAAVITLAAYLLVSHPKLAAQHGTPLLLFLGVFLLPAGALVGGLSYSMQRSTETRFCMSCHEMLPYGQSLLIDDTEPLPAQHYQQHRVAPNTACYTCHSNYALFGPVRTKIAGLRHVWVHFLGDVPDKIELYEPYPNANCLHCHAGARGFESSKHHDKDAVSKADLESGKVSCLTKGCHATVHEAHELTDYELWQPPSGGPL